jgi:hypothetical protein
MNKNTVLGGYAALHIDDTHCTCAMRTILDYTLRKRQTDVHKLDRLLQRSGLWAHLEHEGAPTSLREVVRLAEYFGGESPIVATSDGNLTILPHHARWLHQARVALRRFKRR